MSPFVFGILTFLARVYGNAIISVSDDVASRLQVSDLYKSDLQVDLQTT